MKSYIVKLDQAIPVVYFSVSFAICIVFALVVPPFQVADEFVHFFYASGVSTGAIFPTGLPDGSSGGLIPEAHIQISKGFHSIPFNADIKLDRTLLNEIASVRYNGSMSNVSFGAAALYSPIAYLVPGISLALFRFLDLSPLDAFYAGRIANATFWLLVITLSLKYLTRGRVFFSAVVMMPMLLSQLASYSSDAATIGLTALIAMLISRLWCSPIKTLKEYLFPAVLCGVLATIKPPAILLVLPLMFICARNKDWTALVVVSFASVSLPLIWFVFSSSSGMAQGDYAKLHNINPSMQLEYLLESPFQIFYIAYNTISENILFYYKSAVGIFGWLDTLMPNTFYYILGIALVIAFIGSLFEAHINSISLSIICTVSFLLYSAGIFAALYLSWSPVGAQWVSGVQGRYFLNAFLIFAIAIPSLSKTVSWGILAIPLVWFLQIICTAESLKIIIYRYYLV